MSVGSFHALAVQAQPDLAPRKVTVSACPFAVQALVAGPSRGIVRRLTLATGGAEGIRTPDLRRAKAALSQLSYGPVAQGKWASLESNQGPQSYQDCALAD